MTTLLQRCKEVTFKTEKLSFAQRHANQQKQVQERTREWKSDYDRLKTVTSRTACLALGAEARKSVAEKRENLRHNAAQVLERLKSHDDICLLTEDNLWMRLLASVQGLVDEIETGGKLAWRSYVDDQGTLEDPSLLRSRAPPTPMNDAAIAAYKTQYAVYASIIRLALPRSADDLSLLPQVIAACRAEAAKITFNVSPDVRRFFQDIHSGSATLASVTPAVLEWLAENRQLECYLIRAAGR
ncbi:MAG: hypothetical protein Q8Q81_01720 [Oxalobacteraceae bacterium]|nr:hypothetical protein [Oxalobacteraceae bacterium]